MTRFTPVSLFFFLAALALISHAFTLPLLRRDNISELKAAIQLATSDVATLSQQISIASWAYTLAPVRPGDNLTSAFLTTSKDIQKCIADVNSITSSVDASDAGILLNPAEDFANTVTGMLGNVRSKYSAFKKRNMVANILNEVRNLSGGVMEMTEKLESILPSQPQGVVKGLQQQMESAFQLTISLYASS